MQVRCESWLTTICALAACCFSLAGASRTAAQQAAAIGGSSLSPAALGLTSNPQSALFLTQLVGILQSTTVLNAVTNDADTTALALAADTEDTTTQTQAQNAEVAAYINYFFTNPTSVFNAQMCAHVTDHMTMRIAGATSWLADVQHHLSCINGAAASIQGCWGVIMQSIEPVAATSMPQNTQTQQTVQMPVYNPTQPYALWQKLEAMLTIVIGQLQGQEITLTSLCTAYFQQNPSSTIARADFESALTALLTEADNATDTNSNTSISQEPQTSTSMVSSSELLSATDVLSQQIWQIHVQLTKTAKPAARICTQNVPPADQTLFQACWSAPFTVSNESVASDTSTSQAISVPPTSETPVVP